MTNCTNYKRRRVNLRKRSRKLRYATGAQSASQSALCVGLYEELYTLQKKKSELEEEITIPKWSFLRNLQKQWAALNIHSFIFYAELHYDKRLTK